MGFFCFIVPSLPGWRKPPGGMFFSYSGISVQKRHLGALPGSGKGGGQFQHPVQRLAPSQGLAHDIIHPRLVAGNDGLQPQRRSHSGSHPAQATPFSPRFQGVHTERHLAVPQPLHQPALQRLPVHPACNPVRCQHREHTAAKGDVAGVQNKGLQTLIFLAHQPYHITGPAEAGGDANHQRLFIPVRPGLIQGVLNGAAIRQRGLGDLTGEAVVYLLRSDIDLVIIFPLWIPDLQGKDPHVVHLPHRLGHVTARVHQNANFLQVHNISSQTDCTVTQAEARTAAPTSNMT